MNKPPPLTFWNKKTHSFLGNGCGSCVAPSRNHFSFSSDAEINASSWLKLPARYNCPPASINAVNLLLLASWGISLFGLSSSAKNSLMLHPTACAMLRNVPTNIFSFLMVFDNVPLLTPILRATSTIVNPCAFMTFLISMMLYFLRWCKCTSFSALIQISTVENHISIKLS